MTPSVVFIVLYIQTDVNPVRYLMEHIHIYIHTYSAYIPYPIYILYIAILVAVVA